MKIQAILFSPPNLTNQKNLNYNDKNHNCTSNDTFVRTNSSLGFTGTCNAPDKKTKKKAIKALEKLEIKYEEDPKTGLLIINDDYESKKLKNLNFFYRINEQSLFSVISEITGNANFQDSPLTTLGNLEKIGKDARFGGSEITSLGKLKEIGGDAYFTNSKIKSLGNLEIIGRDAHFEYSEVTSLGNLREIGRDAYLDNSKITAFGNVERIGRNVYAVNSSITDFGKLREIGGEKHFNIDKTITSYQNLERIIELTGLEHWKKWLPKDSSAKDPNQKQDKKDKY